MITEASVPVGRSCSRNAQCETANCSAKGICQCANDPDCGSGRYCKLGTLDWGANECTPRKTEGESCSEDRQCGAPAVCNGKPLGKCVTLASVPLGGSCARDAQCTTGSCDNNGVCQCSQDGDCGSGASCDKGSLGLGRNICVSNAPTVTIGNACLRDSQCVSGSCSSKGYCQCNGDGDCGSASGATPASTRMPIVANPNSAADRFAAWSESSMSATVANPAAARSPA